jgi:hypothetical protein
MQLLDVWNIEQRALLAAADLPVPRMCLIIQAIAISSLKHARSSLSILPLEGA